MYFKEFDKIYYGFDIKGEQSIRILTDIVTNIRFKKNVLENITLYDEYDLQDGDTPEIVAEKFYGNPEYHWIIMLANQRYDYIADFPLSQNELHDFVEAKYGADKKDHIHHYEKNDEYVEPYVVLKIPFQISEYVHQYDFIRNSNVNGKVQTILSTFKCVNDASIIEPYSIVSLYNKQRSIATKEDQIGTALVYETSQLQLLLMDIDLYDNYNINSVKSISNGITWVNAELSNENYVRLLVLVDFGRFIDGDTVSLMGIRYSNKVASFNEVISFTLQTNCMSMSDIYSPITNMMYEEQENEKKRRIKIIDPSLVSQILKEFKELV